MGKMQIEDKKITLLDLRIVVAVVICFFTATILNYIGLKFTCGEMKIEIIQKMTSCIACLLCCQDNLVITQKAGINRLIITAIGGALGILVTIIDNAVGNQWFLIILIGFGVLFTLFFCKLANVPYVNCRIGGLTFILVTCTLQGAGRIWYALFRFVSTFYGVIITLFVTWLFGLMNGKKG